jgi:hypothetical protein
MSESVVQTVARFRQTMTKVRRKNKTPAKARAFLLRTGMLEKDKKSPHGVRLAKQFR